MITLSSVKHMLRLKIPEPSLVSTVQFCPNECVEKPSQVQYRVKEALSGFSSKVTATLSRFTRDSKLHLKQVCIKSPLVFIIIIFMLHDIQGKPALVINKVNWTSFLLFFLKSSVTYFLSLPLHYVNVTVLDETSPFFPDNTLAPYPPLKAVKRNWRGIRGSRLIAVIRKPQANRSLCYFKVRPHSWSELPSN